MRKIAVLTGTRADYGLLYWIIKGIQDDSKLELQLIVTGMHLSPEFGLTVKEIERDGVPIAARVEMLLSSDTELSIATSMGLGMIGFARAYEDLKPDILVVLGDRFETLSAVSAAVPFRIPVAHIHGGETTEGAIDELFRHAITKMSHIHFTATEKYRERVVQMGENPENVFCVGAPGLDNVNKLSPVTREELFKILQLPQCRTLGVVTYHPATLEKNAVQSQISVILEALREVQNIYWVVTLPNADTGGRIITELIYDFVKKNLNTGKVFISLGRQRYLSLLKYADVMVGNSSSGLIEAPSYKLPVVNIGNRQKGRFRAENVIDVPSSEKKDIVAAITRAISKEFRESLVGLENPYGDGHTSVRIIERLKTASLDDKIIKQFHEIKIS